MNVVTKATATVEAVDTEDPNGEFDVILSTDALDRDGDTLSPDEWKQPLPDHITFDSDHGMSVEKTVGSGRPFINDNGQLQVRGTFASTPHAQAVRTLVKEGHIATTSVAFMASKTKKDAKPQRELLNGSFVAIPANPEAVVLSAKAAKTDTENAADANEPGEATEPDPQDMVQAMHDAACHLGAKCGAADKTSGKSITGTPHDSPADSDSASSAADEAAVDAVDLSAEIAALQVRGYLAQARAFLNQSEQKGP